MPDIAEESVVYVLTEPDNPGPGDRLFVAVHGGCNYIVYWEDYNEAQLASSVESKELRKVTVPVLYQLVPGTPAVKGKHYLNGNGRYELYLDLR